MVVGSKTKKWYIEIFTNRLGWTTVELLSSVGPKLLIKLANGQIIKRKPKRVRWERVTRIPGEKITPKLKKFKRKKHKKHKRKPNDFKQGGPQSMDRKKEKQHVQKQSDRSIKGRWKNTQGTR